MLITEQWKSREYKVTIEVRTTNESRAFYIVTYQLNSSLTDYVLLEKIEFDTEDKALKRFDEVVGVLRFLIRE
jgi:hypothetical protein